MKNKVVLVTGGAGFVGSHLVRELLKKGVEKVVVVDNFFLGKVENVQVATEGFSADRFKVYREDATEYTALQSIFDRESVDLVFDLATKALPYSFVHPEGAFDVNTRIANNLASLLRRGCFDRLLHFSSSEVYGSAEYLPMDEKHPLNPTTPYASGKASADLLLQSNVRVFGLKVGILRPFNIYGERQNDTAYSALIPVTVKRLLKGVKPVVEGGGLQTRDFTYVGDVVSGALKMVEKNVFDGSVVQVCSGRQTSVKQVVRLISRLMGYRGSFEWRDRRPADVQDHCGSFKLAERRLGWKPVVGLEEGLKRTIAGVC